MNKLIKTADFRTNLPGYENFIAFCPECGWKNIYNRISDLKDTYLIDSKLVDCLNKDCLKQFYINSDIVSGPYDSMIRDCYELVNEKKYIACVMTLCQALESFFYHAIKVRLILEPFQRNASVVDLNDINKLFMLLSDMVDNFTYGRMKLVFLDLYFFEREFSSLDEIRSYIKSLRKIDSKKDGIVSLIKSSNKAKDKHFKLLQNLAVHSLRNAVVHKYAYRPSVDEVTDALEKTRAVISHFKAIHHIKDIESYLN